MSCLCEVVHKLLQRKGLHRSIHTMNEARYLTVTVRRQEKATQRKTNDTIHGKE